jgi:GNAT superfamily N-acetyltransferase
LSGVKIRAMRPDDLEAAIAAVRDGGWGDRRPALQFYVQHAACHPLVAELDGTIVGTAVATRSGRVGWLGLVFVAPALRGRGLGATLTHRSLALPERLDCRSVLLAASELGQPIYDRLGFVVEGGYAVFHGPKAPAPPDDRRLRPLAASDLDQVVALDRAAADEDRSEIIRALADGWVLAQASSIDGFALRTPWGSGPVVVADPRDGPLLLDMLRSQSLASRTTITVPTANTAVVDYLQTLGFEEERRLPRMRLGAPVDWQTQPHLEHLQLRPRLEAGGSHRGTVRATGRGSLRPPAASRCSARKLAARSFPRRPPASRRACRLRHALGISLSPVIVSTPVIVSQALVV